MQEKLSNSGTLELFFSWDSCLTGFTSRLSITYFFKSCIIQLTRGLITFRGHNRTLYRQHRYDEYLEAHNSINSSLICRNNHHHFTLTSGVHEITLEKNEDGGKSPWEAGGRSLAQRAASSVSKMLNSWDDSLSFMNTLLKRDILSLKVLLRSEATFYWIILNHYKRLEAYLNSVKNMRNRGRDLI